jgi:hypothetical protein
MNANRKQLIFLAHVKLKIPKHSFLSMQLLWSYFICSYRQGKKIKAILKIVYFQFYALIHKTIHFSGKIIFVSFFLISSLQMGGCENQ